MLRRILRDVEGEVAKSRVMVALRDQESAQGLVTLACQLANGMDAELVALHVVEVPMVTPLEADDAVLDHPGKEILARAKQVAKRLSRKLETRLLRARDVGEAVIGEVKEQEIDLLVVGHRRPHPPLAELLLGSTAQYVAHRAPCRVIVQIPPLPHR